MNQRNHPNEPDSALGASAATGGPAGSPGIAQVPPASFDPELVAHVRRKINMEFDRISASFRSAINRQSCAVKRAEIEVALALFEAKRDTTLSTRQLQFFVQDRGSVDDQAQRVIVNDVRYQAIKSIRAVRSEQISTAMPAADTRFSGGSSGEGIYSE